MSVEVNIINGPLSGMAWLDDEVSGVGAVLRFDGVVRPRESGLPIDGLEYQTYDPMAERQLRHLAERTVEKFGVVGVRVVHSRGFVPAGGCSFRLQIASSHREEGLAGMGWFINMMKRDVPIWKRALFSHRAQAGQSQEVERA